MFSIHTPRRIVSLQPSATVILRELGALDRLVACTRYCADVCPGVAVNRAIIDDSWSAKSDEILAARPDLVIAAVPYQEKSVSQILKAGVRFLGLAPRTLADIYVDIGIIASIVGLPAGGEEIVKRMQCQIELIRDQAQTLPRRRVFCEEWGKPLIASQPWVAELAEAAGGEFISPPGIQTTPESVLAADPDVLIAAWCGAGDRVPLEKIVSQRGWSALKAAQHRNIYCVADELLNTPAPTLIGGLHALAAAIHPENFPQVCGLRRISDVSRKTRPSTDP